MKLETFDLSYFFNKKSFGSDSFLNHQPIINTLEWYVLSWKSERLHTSKLKPLYAAFLHGIKLYRNKMGIKPLTVDQNNYTTKMLNACFVYDLDNGPDNPVRNFSIKKFLVWCN